MLAPGYAGNSETPAEALNHGVALWTVEDLVALLRAGPGRKGGRPRKKAKPEAA